MHRLLLGSLAISALVLSAISVAWGAEEDRTRSPYFFVPDGDPATDALPLKETRADLEVAGVIARVRLTQVYANQGSRPLEAIYIFPASTQAAIGALKMTIGERTIVAEIRTRDRAVKDYQQAKNRGQSASLLEQERPNVFQMRVANILPGDRIRVELEYSELLVPDDGVYQLVHPTVVGPRYAGGAASQNAAKDHDRWIANPTLAPGHKSSATFALHARISAGLPIRAVTSPSHKISPRFISPSVVEIESEDPASGDRDFILRYRLSQDAIESGVLLYPGVTEEENFFLLMLEPPARVEPSAIPPRELIFIVDVSGSMMGFPLNTAKRLVHELSRGLRKQDRFNLMLFSGGSRVLAPASVPATPEALAGALQMLDAQQGGGVTEIVPAMRAALSMPRAAGMSTSLVVITDGYVTVEKEVFSLVRQNLGKANLFAFGIGSSVNRFLIEGLARAGLGQSFVVTDQGEAEDKATQFLRYVDSPVLTEVHASFDGFQAYDIEPPALPDLFSRRPVLLFGKYRGAPSGAITVSGRGGNGPWSKRIELAGAQPDPALSALRPLWARHRIQSLSDEQALGVGDDHAAAITKLGLEYHLLTEGTSLVAIDSQVRNTQGTTSVRQPVSLPHGVAPGTVSQVLGVLRGTEVGDAHGAGGLGLRGNGSGSGGYGAGRGALSFASPMVQGSIDKETIRRVIQSHRMQVGRCFERELLRDPSLGGKLVLRLVIGSKGKVIQVELASSTLHSTAVESCVLKSAEGWLFPAPAGGGQVIVNYPFVFAPG